ncbi:MAG TPA: prepilin-type N-terminal cleavage/methylation domain-containing protein [Longimicrobiales bacterium]|nr:prepilin-type N-terminal cleavage/methylation domain-containing protein [Longimicrobiales bacterium]
MHKRREGFTLIELLIVIVIIGILAAIAIPKFGATRERAYVKAMESDLRNLAAQQEIYYSDSGSSYNYFTGDIAWDDGTPNDLNLTLSTGVTLSITGVAATGGEQPYWYAEASHEATPVVCALYTGGTPADPASELGVIGCAAPTTTTP